MSDQLKLRPLHDFVVIRREEPKKQTAGGIHLPEESQNKALRGEVLAVGPGRVLDNGTRIPVDVKVGDIVALASQYSGTEVELGGEKLTVVRDGECLGTISH